jgi:hypothetical protein
MSALMHRIGFQRVSRALIAVAAASALASTLPANAAAAPNHVVPSIGCDAIYGHVVITVPMPMFVQTPYRSEQVTLRFHLYKKNQYGGWDFKLNGQFAYTNHATSGGALLGQWLPDGNYHRGYAASDSFWLREPGTYRVAMYLVWGPDPFRPRDSTYVWTYNTCAIS